MQSVQNNDSRIRKRPAIQLYNECPVCKTWAYGHYDAYCSRCGSKLKDDEMLVGIRDYAKALLIEFLDNYPELAMKSDISEIPDYATDGIRANGNVLFNQYATRRILAECWNEVETALDDWKDNTGLNYPISNIEQLHVFSITHHTEMIWRLITHDMDEDHLDDETIAGSIERLEHS